MMDTLIKLGLVGVITVFGSMFIVAAGLRWPGATGVVLTTGGIIMGIAGGLFIFTNITSIFDMD